VVTSFQSRSFLDEQNKQEWQNINYVHRLFGGRKREARKIYRDFVEKGIAEGRRPDPTDGRLLRSFGGWTALKGFRKTEIRVKVDEGILGDSDFVENVLKSAEEELEEKYELKARGYDFDWAICRVAEVLDMPPRSGDGLRKVLDEAEFCLTLKSKLSYN
jgi:hypothetical protein